MTSALKMKTYIPEYLRTSQVITSILDAEGVEIDLLNSTIEDVLLQFFAETATEIGLNRWEHFLDLSSAAGKPIVQRRERIISKLRGAGTITIALIKNVAESFVYGHVMVTDHPENYSFTIKFIDPYGVPANLTDVQAAIEEIKPAHLAVIYEFTYIVWSDVKRSTWGGIKNRTWGALRTTAIP